MPLLISVLVTLVVLCLVFSLLYWGIQLIGGILPVPMKQPVTTVLLILLILIAVICLLDLTGLLGARHVLIPIR